MRQEVYSPVLKPEDYLETVLDYRLELYLGAVNGQVFPAETLRVMGEDLGHLLNEHPTQGMSWLNNAEVREYALQLTKITALRGRQLFDYLTECRQEREGSRAWQSLYEKAQASRAWSDMMAAVGSMERAVGRKATHTEAKIRLGMNRPQSESLAGSVGDIKQVVDSYRNWQEGMRLLGDVDDAQRQLVDEVQDWHGQRLQLMQRRWEREMPERLLSLEGVVHLCETLGDQLRIIHRSERARGFTLPLKSDGAPNWENALVRAQWLEDAEAVQRGFEAPTQAESWLALTEFVSDAAGCGHALDCEACKRRFELSSKNMQQLTEVLLSVRDPRGPLSYEEMNKVNTYLNSIYEEIGWDRSDYYSWYERALRARKSYKKLMQASQADPRESQDEVKALGILAQEGLAPTELGIDAVGLREVWEAINEGELRMARSVLAGVRSMPPIAQLWWDDLLRRHHYSLEVAVPEPGSDEGDQEFECEWDEWVEGQKRASTLPTQRVGERVDPPEVSRQSHKDEFETAWRAFTKRQRFEREWNEFAQRMEGRKKDTPLSEVYVDGGQRKEGGGGREMWGPEPERMARLMDALRWYVRSQDFRETVIIVAVLELSYFAGIYTPSILRKLIRP